jgi:M3 family oligoendopeptidase
MGSLVSIRYKINTKDKFYQNERKIFDEISPTIENLDRDFFEIIVKSKFKGDLKKKYGRNLLEKMELSVKIISPAVIKLLEKENKLISEYSKLIGSAELSFDNKKMNLSEIHSYFESKDRKTRKEVNEIYWNFFSDNEKKFDDIYDKLVKVRHEIAIKLGYDNFIDLAYDRWGRNDFDKKDVKQLRETLVKNFIPLTRKIREWQRKNLKLDKLRYYDESIFLNEEIRPKGDTDSKIKNTQKMFLEMGEETKEFFSFMVSNNLLDLIPRKGKAAGGFCDFIVNEKAPFIFMNFNDTPNDIITLIHECGHALETYLNKDKDFCNEWSFLGLEIAEIHSMSMEFFSWPWAKNFFDEENKFKLIHLIKSILFIPYGLLVDEFQHWVFENHEASPQKRKLMWRELEKKYLPDTDYEENDFLKSGAFWFRQLHLFEIPFYYIDYVIAQLCAFQYLIKSKQDFSKSWEEYIDLINSAIDKSLLETIKIGNLKNPFKEDALKEITSNIESLFDKLS